MNTILIYGNNKISTFLHTSFGESGLLSIDITQNLNTLDDLKDIYAVLDVSNTDTSLDEASDLIHNTAEIKELIDLSFKVKAPYIFLYREKEEIHPESPLITAIDLIKTYCEKRGVKYATVQVEDIYGPEINTSKKLEEILSALTSGSNILTVDNDDNEHYLFHQKDFVSGLRQLIKNLHDSPSAKSKHYTLYPEDPITEIELAHFLKDLTDFDLEITYTHDDKPPSFVAPEAEINYPENWWPEVNLKAGLEDLCDYHGIPILENAEEELAEENSRFSNEDRFGDTSSPEEHHESDGPYDPFDEFDKRRDGFNDYEYNEEETRESEDTYEEHHNDFDYAEVDASQKTAPKQTKPKRKPRKAIAALAVILLVAASLPSLTFAYNAASGFAYLNKASGNIQNMDLNSAYANSNKAIEFLNKTEKIPAPIGFIASRAGISDRDQHLIIETANEISQAINYLSGIDLYATFKNLDSHEIALNSDSGVLGVSTVAEPEYIDKSLEKIEKVENNFENLETRNKFVRDLITQNINSLNKNKDKLYKIKAIEPALSQLLGYDRRQTYLLLIQNLNVARSSGGRVEVFGIMNAENGKLAVSKLEKSADSHDQINLNGRLPAPEPIQELTNQEYLYMEDVTWDPDFKNASRTAINLYSYLGDEDLDGVIAIDTNLLKNLIKALGEIRVGDKVINETNFAENITKDTGADLIRDSFTYIFDTFKNDPESFKTLEPLLYNALNSHNMMIFHKDETTYSSIVENSWGGLLKGADTDEFLYFTDNNLTDVRSEKIALEVTYDAQLPTDDRGYVRTVDIKYTNNGDSDYLGHSMTLVPEDTLINSAKLISGNDEKNITRSIKTSQYENKALYETALYIPSKQSVNLKIEYESPLKDYKDQYMDISLQKQPGAAPVPLSIRLTGKTSSTSNIIFDNDKYLKFPL